MLERVQFVLYDVGTFKLYFHRKHNSLSHLCLRLMRMEFLLVSLNTLNVRDEIQ